MIHPTACIDKKAELEGDVCVGPFAVIDAGVRLGAGCWVGPHAHLTGLTTAGPGNRFHAGCVIGDAPQDLKYKGDATRLTIGANNIFREHVTVHRSNQLAEDTTIGSNNFLMAHSHVGHNCHLGDHVVLANAALVAGHVTIEDRAFISGSCLIHQFVRVGKLALMQGGSGISKDLPPFCIARGDNHICGLNIIGLRRAGLPIEERSQLKLVYRQVFRQGQPIRKAAQKALADFPGGPARYLLDFILASTRGVCSHFGKSGDEEA